MPPAVLAVVGLAVVVVLGSAVAGPWVVTGRHVSWDLFPGQSFPTSAALSPPSSNHAAVSPPVEASPVLGVVARVIVGLAAVALVALLVVVTVGLVRRARAALEQRAAEPEPMAPGTDGVDLDEAHLPALRAAVARAGQHLDDAVPPGDAVISAWVALERAAEHRSGPSARRASRLDDGRGARAGRTVARHRSHGRHRPHRSAGPRPGRHAGARCGVREHRRTCAQRPAAVRLGALPLPFRLRGLTGAHESQRPGDGGGLRDVHPFAPGDRLRRIDWRVTARRSPDLSELYVRRTFALADAVVMLVVDSRDDVGPDPATWSGFLPVRPQDATSLDLARQAAASIARDLVAVGDRVGLDDLGVRRRPVAPGGGRRQLDRIVHRLALIHPEGEPTVRLRAPQLPSGVLVIVFSTFLDDGAARAARSWRRSGHRVVAVDVLPRVRAGALNQRERLALRLVLIERTDRLAELTPHGVELVPWATGEPAVELIRLARRSHRRPGVGVAR